MLTLDASGKAEKLERLGAAGDLTPAPLELLAGFAPKHDGPPAAAANVVVNVYTGGVAYVGGRGDNSPLGLKKETVTTLSSRDPSVLAAGIVCSVTMEEAGPRDADKHK